MQTNLACLRKNTVLMLIKIKSWLRKPKVWRFVCFFPSVIGLLCYALSSSFNNLYGNWTWWKISLYIVFSFNVCLALLFAKACERSISPRLEAHLAFFILMMTSVYSFFFDKEMKGKPDAYSLVSSAAFAIMSLGLAKLSHLGFEVDLLYFFSGVLTVEIMKIKLWLVIVGGSFSYSLIILRSTLDAPTRSGYHEFQDRDHVVIELGSNSQSQGTRSNLSATQVDSPQTIITVAQEAGSNSDNNSILAQFMGCIEELKKENGNVVNTILKHLDQWLKAKVIDYKQPSALLLETLPQLLHIDDNLVVDSLPSGVINDLRESGRLMVTAGLEEECLHLYTTCRGEFLREILSTIASKTLNMEEDVDMEEDINKVMKKQYWIKALLVAHRILLPNERRLCERIFEGHIHLEDKFLPLPRIDDAVMSGKSLAVATAPLSLGRIGVSSFEKSFGIWVDLLYPTSGVKEHAIVPGGGLHQITLDMWDYSEMLWQNSYDLSIKGMFSRAGHMAEITDQLDSILEAISKNYNNPALGYVFIMNNWSFIEQIAKQHRLGRIFGNHWPQENATKFHQKLELYQRSSWNKILDILKLDINESEPNVAAELMKNKLHSFNEHFDDICNDQAAWFALNEKLRKQIIESTEHILLPAYGNFVGRLQDFLGNQAYEHVKYGMFDIQKRLNNLFLVRE